tara:strand:+ start:1234 stop:1539 length:306 start_codon:yes stop_codon:yes gene_type:complete
MKAYDAWGIIYLQGHSALTEAQRDHTAWEAIDMLLQQDDTRRVENDPLEVAGEINATGKYRNVGTFAGREYEARLDVSNFSNRIYVSFLVTELSGSLAQRL